MTSVGYALFLAAVFCSQATAVEVNEAVLEEGASGTAVVLLSVAHIQQAAIFPDDNQLLRRIAYVETRDGTDSDTNNEGGIWAVSEAAFESTKGTSTALLALKYELILQQFSIVWQSVQLSDLRRPLYSALAARLVLFTAPRTIPSDTDVTGQAVFWREIYNTDGSVDEYIEAIRELQGDSGSDFYVGFARNAANEALLQLFVTTREADPVPFTVDTLLGFHFTGVATRDSTTVVTLSNSHQVFNSTERNKGIRVSAGGKQIAVSGLNYRNFSSDAFLALPCSHLPVDQYEYYAISYDDAISSQLLFVGCEDNTTVTFTSTTVTLNQMETYLYEMSPDITGTGIVSNKPISFFTGHLCANVPSEFGGCDHLTEQIPPTATWGTRFLSASFLSRMTDVIYRVLASQSSTTVSVNCTTYTQPETYSLATAGEWQEFRTPDDSFCVIESDRPLLVVEFALGGDIDEIGDPFMIMLPPVEQYSNDYIFNAPVNFSANFITIFVAPEYFEPEKIFVDDISQEQADWTSIHCLDRTVCGYAAYASLEAGDHRLYHSDHQARIGVSIYGFKYFGSYGYPGDLQPVPINMAAVSFSQGTYFVGENKKTLNVSVVRSGNTESHVMVLIASDPILGSATAGEDYITVTKILEFSPGVIEKEVEIGILDDTFIETNESFVLYLSSGVGVLLSPTAQAEVTIVNNDMEIDSGAIVIGASTAAAVAVLLIISGCVVTGIAFWRHKEKLVITVARNSAYEDVRQDSGVADDVSYGDTSLYGNSAHGGASQDITMAENTAYDYASQDITMAENTAYDYASQDIKMAENTAYDYASQNITMAENTAHDYASQDITMAENTAYDYASQEITMAKNTAYDYASQDITIAHNTAACGDIGLKFVVAHNAVYEEVV